MSGPAYRTQSLRRTKTKTPGGKTVVHFGKKAKGPHRCPVTGLEIGGMNKKTYRFRISLKAPNRPHGGVFSHKVLARALRRAVRK